MVGVTAAAGVGSAGALAEAGAGAMLGTAADAEPAALAPDGLALLEEPPLGLDEPQALTSSVPAITEAPASQPVRADRMTFFRCMRES
jgi:hypothetical protein